MTDRKGLWRTERKRAAGHPAAPVVSPLPPAGGAVRMRGWAWTKGHVMRGGVDRGRCHNYWRLSYRRKFIRTCWAIALLEPVGKIPLNPLVGQE
jgi:hypothetical protein